MYQDEIYDDGSPNEVGVEEPTDEELMYLQEKFVYDPSDGYFKNNPRHKPSEYIEDEDEKDFYISTGVIVDPFHVSDTFSGGKENRKMEDVS